MFVATRLASDQHKDVSAIICAGSLKQIEDVVRDAQRAGWRDDDFAVVTSDRELNALGSPSEVPPIR